ncbi:methyltransferase type 11 [Ammoniphilus oxalaticus]|uniref:Methyltransferase type 11 n=1 Tax=Ammoniphilus oxalaticus TaxID=66863 RepID=A0A419SKP8_9BACL|nr:class I SAM-dependent methyltransferase [Ammoniphilus oxalaticus]RKD24506.1 methyltransferase type 11 [Ammoniphilus oxalaticus]
MSERRFDPAKFAKLDNPERRKALPPKKLLGMLAIQENDDILDLGAGTGYFSLPAATMTKGTIYALDVEPQMLEMLKERSAEQGVVNIQFIEGKIEELPLADALVDHVIASYVLHEIDPLSAGLTEIHRALKKGGKCLCLEWEKKETEQGPPLHHRIHSSDLQQAMEAAGFTIIEKSFPTDQHYILIAQKNG